MAVPCLLVVGLSKERSADIHVDPPAEPTDAADPGAAASGAAQSIHRPDVESCEGDGGAGGFDDVSDGRKPLSFGEEQKQADAAEPEREGVTTEQEEEPSPDARHNATGVASRDGKANENVAWSGSSNASEHDGTKDHHEDAQGATAQ
jgi:hypothetical protein